MADGSEERGARDLVRRLPGPPPWLVTVAEAAVPTAWLAVLVACVVWAFSMTDFRQIGLPFAVAILASALARSVGRRVRDWARARRFDRALHESANRLALDTAHLGPAVARVVDHAARLRAELLDGSLAEPRRAAFEWIHDARTLRPHEVDELRQAGIDLPHTARTLQELLVRTDDASLPARLVDALKPLERVATDPSARGYR